MTTKKINKILKKSASPLTPEQTIAWVNTYGRHYRIYAWGFFFVVLCIIFGVIWWDVGEINKDVLYSFGFVVIVTFLLAMWTLRNLNKNWQGEVKDLFVKKVRIRRENAPDEIGFRPMIKIRTDRGKNITLRVPENLFNYFKKGDRVFKVSGFDWPEKVDLDTSERVCLVCSGLFTQGSGQCPRCRAPEPDHATLKHLAART
ncbi:MAG: hypothetical protein XD41_2139 [Desulfonauticus sp. 38_4375]|nr:MAG: hypothetical protein XD41_2139 [Desulfonauticus sp. 38_4375]